MPRKTSVQTAAMIRSGRKHRAAEAPHQRDHQRQHQDAGLGDQEDLDVEQEGAQHVRVGRLEVGAVEERLA